MALERDQRAARLWIEERRQEQLERDDDFTQRGLELDQRAAQLIELTNDLVLREQAAAETQYRQQNDQLALDSRAFALDAEQAQLRAEAQRIASEQTALEEALVAIDASRHMIHKHETLSLQQIEARREASQATIRSALAMVEAKRLAALQEAEEVEQRAAERLRQALEPTVEEELRWQQINAAADVVSAREERLAEAEALLSHGHDELKRLQAELDEARRQVDAQLRIERRRLADQQRRSEAELAEQRLAIERQSEELDHRQAALDQSGDEVSQLHRETLELRLATEELWAQLAGNLPPAVLTHALGQTRAKLDEHYRLVIEQVDQRRAELGQMRTELASAEELLEAQNTQLQSWVVQRNQDLEARAEVLARQEQQLEEHSREHTRQRQAWEVERLELEQELRRLRNDASRATAAARATVRSGMDLASVEPVSTG
jgi:hypothetical protein